MRKSDVLKIIKKEVQNGIDNVEDLAFKLKISMEECAKLLEEVGIDILNESVNDELNEGNLDTLDTKKQKVLNYLKKETSINAIAEDMNISVYEVSGIIKELKGEGYNILHIIKNNEEVALNLGNESLRKQSFLELPVEGEFAFLALSDTRLCSYYEQMSILKEIYLRAFKEGALFALHLGDITEGVHTNNYLKDTIFAHDTYSQKEYTVGNYPYIDGFKTYFIIGEHDETHMKTESSNIGKLISNEREDMVYLGQRRAVVRAGNTNILMRHPKGKVAYTMSYKSQRHINAMRSEDKVNIVLNGHWCYMDEYVLRKVNQFSIPSVVANTPEMDFLDTPNTVGAYLITVKLDEKGNFKKTTYRRICYYQTIKEDYRRIKPLRLEKNTEEYEKILMLRKESK